MDTIVAWANHKRVIVHTSDLMMIIRQSIYIISIITIEIGKLKTYSPIYCIISVKGARDGFEILRNPKMTRFIECWFDQHGRQIRLIASSFSKIVASHYSVVIMGVIASQITSLFIVYSTLYPGAQQRKHQSSASLAFVRGIHGWPVNSPHKWPVTRKMFPFHDVIMHCLWKI